MKTFTFPLEQALRWRGTQQTLLEARVAAAAATVARIQAQLDSVNQQLHLSAAQIRQAPSGEALNAHAGFSRQASLKLREHEKQLHEAQRKLNAEMNLLIQARRRLKLIEELKTAARDRWQRDLEKETADFADERHLAARAAKNRALQSNKRAGA